MILYIETLKDSIRKLLELMDEYSNVSGYKINTQKSLAFLYTNNEKTKREIKETIPFTIAAKWIKYIGVYLPKETKDLHIENYKTLMLNFVKGFFCILWDNHVVFIFQFVKVVYYIDWFADIKESLHSLDNAHLVMMYESTCLTSGSTTKPKSSRQYGPGTKTEI